MRKFKKRGSSLIVVIMIMAMIFTTGTAVLSLSISDYKMRINESDRLKNFYQTDSGLDTVYNVIIKNSETAIRYANMQLNEEYKNINAEYVKFSDVNNSFKTYFIDFLKSTNIVNKPGDIDTLLQQGIKGKKYVDMKKDGNFIDYQWISDIQNKAVIEITSYSIDNENHKITIDVKSTFEDTDGGFNNKKQISTRFEVIAPDYEQTMSNEIKAVEIGIYPVFNDKVIATDANLIVNGETNIKGNIWVEGDKIPLNDKYYQFPYDKYKGGINILDSKFTLDGNLYTASTLNVNNTTYQVKKISINGDVYALNTYVGLDMEYVANWSRFINLTLDGNLVVNNDLVLDATYSSIEVKKNFYGINDKTSLASTTEEKIMKSSSIIVNDTTNTSTLTVDKDSYIKGVAYMDATDAQGNKYQTGESVAVIGNYLAYTKVLEGDIGKVTLKYYNPFQLLEMTEGKNITAERAEYIKKYYEINSGELKKGGINLLGNVYATGAYIKDGKIQYSGWTNENDSAIDVPLKEFVRNVYCMGDLTGVVPEGKTIYDLYNEGTVKKNVENEVNFSKVVEGKSYDESYGSVVITKNNITIENGKLNGKDINKGIIITDGNIQINGDFNFEGTIIAKGNISFNSLGAKNITKNDEVVRKIIAKNYDELKDLFIGQKINTEVIEVSSPITFEDTWNGYNLKQIVLSKLWKIEK